jgi:hypothetical protein
MFVSPLRFATGVPFVIPETLQDSPTVIDRTFGERRSSPIREFRGAVGDRLWGTDETYPMFGSRLPFATGLLFVCPHTSRLSLAPHHPVPPFSDQVSANMFLRNSIDQLCIFSYSFCLGRLWQSAPRSSQELRLSLDRLRNSVAIYGSRRDRSDGRAEWILRCTWG